ncbi:hypothetical protein FGB62_241g06 [Gracilaria domingensis]|nr:hypothetical protein FGB62_241g06 [Gracilaria domingensis]
MSGRSAGRSAGRSPGESRDSRALANMETREIGIRVVDETHAKWWHAARDYTSATAKAGAARAERDGGGDAGDGMAATVETGATMETGATLETRLTGVVAPRQRRAVRCTPWRAHVRNAHCA